MADRDLLAHLQHRDGRLNEHAWHLENDSGQILIGSRGVLLASAGNGGMPADLATGGHAQHGDRHIIVADESLGAQPLTAETRHVLSLIRSSLDDAHGPR